MFWINVVDEKKPVPHADQGHGCHSDDRSFLFHELRFQRPSRSRLPRKSSSSSIASTFFTVVSTSYASRTNSMCVSVTTTKLVLGSRSRGWPTEPTLMIAFSLV